MPKVGQRSALRSRLLRVFAGFDACDLPESASAIGSQTFMRLPWGPLHLVSAWASEQGLGLGQREVDGTSNEITAIPALLETLSLKNCIVTLDAMGCQQA